MNIFANLESRKGDKPIVIPIKIEIVVFESILVSCNN